MGERIFLGIDLHRKAPEAVKEGTKGLAIIVYWVLKENVEKHFHRC